MAVIGISYNLLSELDSDGEYHIDAKSATLSFMPPTGATTGSYSVSRLQNAVIARGVSNVTQDEGGSSRKQLVRWYDRG